MRSAVSYTKEYVDGKVNHRIMAREIGLTPLEAGFVLETLRPRVEARLTDTDGMRGYGHN